MRAARLRRGEDIARVRSEGIRHTATFFSLRALATGEPTVRVAVASPRAVGNAVQRNRARRRVREALRVALAARPVPRTGADLLLIVRPASLGASALALRETVESQLEAVLR